MSARRLLLSALFLSLIVVNAHAQTFVFDLRGTQEVPPVATNATGGCYAALNAATSQLALNCVHNVAGATAMHIHQGAVGVNGPIVFDFGDPTSPVVATWSSMTPANVADLLAGNLYVNIHSAARPGGEIRGQILARTVDTVAFTAEGGQVEPPNSSASTANCIADLDTTATQISVQCTHNVASPDSAHIHEAPMGVNGPVVFTFPSVGSPLAANVPLMPLQVASFAATFLYLDIHSVTEEIRGQIGSPPQDATADVSITKSGPASVLAGAAISYTITVSNAGPQSASNVVVSDTIPAGTSFDSASPSQGSCAGTTTVTCSLGAIASGGSATITLVVQAPLTPTTVTNFATVANTPEADGVPANNQSASIQTVVDVNPVIPALSDLAMLLLLGAVAAIAVIRLK